MPLLVWVLVMMRDGAAIQGHDRIDVQVDRAVISQHDLAGAVEAMMTEIMGGGAFRKSMPIGVEA